MASFPRGCSAPCNPPPGFPYSGRSGSRLASSASNGPPRAVKGKGSRGRLTTRARARLRKISADPRFGGTPARTGVEVAARGRVSAALCGGHRRADPSRPRASRAGRRADPARSARVRMVAGGAQARGRAARPRAARCAARGSAARGFRCPGAAPRGPALGAPGALLTARAPLRRQHGALRGRPGRSADREARSVLDRDRGRVGEPRAPGADHRSLHGRRIRRTRPPASAGHADRAARRARGTPDLARCVRGVADRHPHAELARPRHGRGVRARGARGVRSAAPGGGPRARPLPDPRAGERGAHAAVRRLIASFDLYPAAEALDRDPRVAVADHERERTARRVAEAVVIAAVVETRGEIRLDAAAVALHVEPRGGVLGQAELAGPADAAPGTAAPFASEAWSSIAPAIVRSSARSICLPSTRILPLTVLACTSPETPSSSISPFSVFATTSLLAPSNLIAAFIVSR